MPQNSGAYIQTAPAMIYPSTRIAWSEESLQSVAKRGEGALTSKELYVSRSIRTMMYEKRIVSYVWATKAISSSKEEDDEMRLG